MPALEVTDASAISPSKRLRTETSPAEERPVLRFAKLSEHATTPTRGSSKAAGYDLYRLVMCQISCHHSTSNRNLLFLFSVSRPL